MPLIVPWLLPTWCFQPPQEVLEHAGLPKVPKSGMKICWKSLAFPKAIGFTPRSSSVIRKQSHLLLKENQWIFCRSSPDLKNHKEIGSLLTLKVRDQIKMLICPLTCALIITFNFEISSTMSGWVFTAANLCKREIAETWNPVTANLIFLVLVVALKSKSKNCGIISNAGV